MGLSSGECGCQFPPPPSFGISCTSLRELECVVEATVGGAANRRPMERSRSANAGTSQPLDPASHRLCFGLEFMGPKLEIPALYFFGISLIFSGRIS